MFLYCLVLSILNGLVYVYLAHLRTAVFLDEQLSLQQNIRYAFDAIRKVVRGVGFSSCRILDGMAGNKIVGTNEVLLVRDTDIKIGDTLYLIDSQKSIIFMATDTIVLSIRIYHEVGRNKNNNNGHFTYQYVSAENINIDKMEFNQASRCSWHPIF